MCDLMFWSWSFFASSQHSFFVHLKSQREIHEGITSLLHNSQSMTDTLNFDYGFISIDTQSKIANKIHLTDSFNRLILKTTIFSFDLFFLFVFCFYLASFNCMRHSFTYIKQHNISHILRISNKFQLSHKLNSSSHLANVPKHHLLDSLSEYRCRDVLTA